MIFLLFVLFVTTGIGLLLRPMDILRFLFLFFIIKIFYDYRSDINCAVYLVTQLLWVLLKQHGVLFQKKGGDRHIRPRPTCATVTLDST